MTKIMTKCDTTKHEGEQLNNLINCNPKIDSYRALIPLTEVTILQKEFGSKYIRYYSELDEYGDELNDNNSYTIIDNGITTNFQLCKRHLESSENLNPEDVLLVFVNAKMLKDRYLEGITKDNITLIYEYLMSLKVVDFDLNTFLNSKATDVDFCIDRIDEGIEAHKALHHKFIDTLYSNILEPLQVTIKLFKVDKETINGKSRLIGFKTQFGERTKGTPSKPYLDIYDKTEELIGGETAFVLRMRNQIPNSSISKNKAKEGSYEFYYNYLRNKDVDRYIRKGITRIECSLRNKRTLDYYSLEAFSIIDYLNVEALKYYDVCKAMFQKYTIKQIIIRDYSDFTPMEKVILNAINQLIIAGLSATEIEGYLLQGFEERSERTNKSRMRKLINELLEDVKNPSKLELNNKNNEGLINRLEIVGLI